MPNDEREERGRRFRDRVLLIVRAVPAGRVVTYGQVALLAGSPGAARRVGAALRGAAESDDVPWQRVVNASGGISTHKIGAGALQEALLRLEGVTVDASGIDLRRYGWTPDGDVLEAVATDEVVDDAL